MIAAGTMTRSLAETSVKAEREKQEVESGKLDLRMELRIAIRAIRILQLNVARAKARRRNRVIAFD
jgi:hypothetical protein